MVELKFKGGERVRFRGLVSLIAAGFWVVLHGTGKLLVLHIQSKVKNSDDNGKQGTVFEYDERVGKYSAMASSCSAHDVAKPVWIWASVWSLHHDCCSSLCFPDALNLCTVHFALQLSFIRTLIEWDLEFIVQPSRLGKKAVGQFVSFCPNLAACPMFQISISALHVVALFHAEVHVNWKSHHVKVKEELHGSVLASNDV